MNVLPKKPTPASASRPAVSTPPLSRRMSQEADLRSPLSALCLIRSSAKSAVSRHSQAMRRRIMSNLRSTLATLSSQLSALSSKLLPPCLAVFIRRRFAAFIFVLCCSSASALTQVGNGDLYVRGSANVAYDSNLFINEADELDDFSTVIFAGLGFVQEERSVLNARLELGQQIARYFDFDEQNSEDWQSNFSLSYPNHIESDTYGEITGGWNEASQASPELGRRIQTETFDLAGNLTHQVSDKVGLSFSLSMSDQTFRDLVNPDQVAFGGRQSDTMSVSLNTSYRYSERLSGNFQYSYRDVSYDDLFANEQTGNTFALGLSGQLQPKVSGSIYVGLQNNTFSDPILGSQSNTDPYYSISLSWAPREKTSVSVSGSSSFQSSASGQVNDTRSLRLGITESLSDKVSLSGGIGFAENDFKGFGDRKDDSMTLSAGYSYILSDSMSLSAQLSYEDRSSSDGFFDYDQLRISAGVSSTW